MSVSVSASEKMTPRLWGRFQKALRPESVKGKVRVPPALGQPPTRVWSPHAPVSQSTTKSPREKGGQHIQEGRIEVRLLGRGAACLWSAVTAPHVQACSGPASREGEHGPWAQPSAVTPRAARAGLLWSSLGPGSHGTPAALSRGEGGTGRQDWEPGSPSSGDRAAQHPELFLPRPGLRCEAPCFSPRANGFQGDR